LSHERRVLVVDGLQETEEVLRAVLQPRGWDVARVHSRRLERGGETPSARLVVLHEDAASDTGGVTSRRQPQWAEVPTVVIGSVDLPADNCEPSAGDRSRLSHPFHYADLIATVDRLLGDTDAGERFSPPQNAETASGRRKAA